MSQFREEFENLDPLSGEKGAHPLGTGLGAIAGGTTGLAGSVAVGAAFGIGGGPIGILAGAAIGAVVGGLLGKGLTEMAWPTEEETYWREQYVSEPYYNPVHTFEDYEPAFRVGHLARLADTRTFEEVEADLEREYQAIGRAASLEWSAYRAAAYAAWLRTDRLQRQGAV